MSRLLAVSACALLVNLAAAGQLWAQNLTITNARIIVGDGKVIEKGSVVVQGGKIASVSAGAPAARPGTAIDGTGMTVMAGYIDGHRHIINGPSDKWFAEQAPKRMQEFLEAGYTTLLSGGGPTPGIEQLKEKVEKGELKGPRIITSGRADPNSFNSEEEIRAAVRKEIMAGAEYIGEVRVDSTPSAKQIAFLKAEIDEANKFGVKTQVHASSPAALTLALDAGAQKLVHTPHGGWLSEALAKRVKDMGVEVLSCVGFGVPLFGVYNQTNTPTFRDGSKWPEEILESEGRGREAGEKVVNGRTLWDAGVVYGFGTDTGYEPGAGLSHELRTLNLMFSPQDMVKILGPNTAAFIDRTDRGTVEAGKLADLVVLSGNPLEGYWNFLNPEVVIKGGVVVVDKRGRPRG